MIVIRHPDAWRARIGELLASWTDEVVPQGVEPLRHGSYSPVYAWMYAYEKELKRRIESVSGQPLGSWERRLFGPDGAFSEGLSNAFLHGHRRDPGLPIRVTCEVGSRGLSFVVRDQGPGFDVQGALGALARGAAYFHMAGNGLRSFVHDPDILVSHDEGGRALHLLVPLEPSVTEPPGRSSNPGGPVAGGQRAGNGAANPLVWCLLDRELRYLRLDRPGGQAPQEGSPLGRSAREIPPSGVAEDFWRQILADADDLWRDRPPAGKGTPGFEAKTVRLSDSGGREWRVTYYALRPVADDVVLGVVADAGDVPQATVDALIATQAELAAVQDNAPILILLLNEAGQVLRANRAARELTARSLHDVQGLQIGDLLRCLRQADDPGGCGFGTLCSTCELRGAILETLRTGARLSRRPASLDLRLPAGHPTRTDLLVSTLPVELGGSRQLLVYLEDVSQVERATRALASSERRFRSLVEQSPHPIVIANGSGAIVVANRTSETFLGYPPGELAGRSLASVLPRLPSSPTGEKSAGSAPVTSLVSVARHWSEAEIPVELTFSRADTDGGSWLMVTILDRRAHVAAEKAKREFVSVVSHELRTPLASIVGSLGLVAGGALGPLLPKAKGLVEIARSNSERLVRLINDLLDAERLEDGLAHFAFQPVAVERLLAQAVEVNQGYAAQYGVRLVAVPPPQSVPAVTADPDRLLQVLTNLLSNATRYAPRGGEVTVFAEQKGELIEIGVRNLGPGIPRELQSRIFDRFTADPSRSAGAGLGLHICKSIVERHRGVIWFETGEQGGTTFYFTVPSC